MNATIKKTSLSTTMLVSLMTGAAAAQDGGAPSEGADGDVIVVTAQKREERLIDVPQAISVLTADDLDKAGITQLRDLAGVVPGLTIASRGAGQNQISLRGVTTGGIDTSATVSTYFDEVPYGSSTGFGRNSQFTSDGALFNVSRLEVLRGPQGTLYGASSLGGLLKYVTIEPDPSGFSGSAGAAVSFTKGGDVNYRGSLAVNMPITDNAALRVSGYYTHDGGFIDNVANDDEDVNQSDLGGVRADLLVEPTEQLSVRLVGEAQWIERDGMGSVDFTPDPDRVPIVGGLSQVRPIAEPLEQEFLLFAATVNYDFGPVTLTSISSYQETDTDAVQDSSAQFVPLLDTFFGPVFGGFGITDMPETEKFTQEIRLASNGENFINWVLGGFYTNEDSTRVSEAALEDTAGAPAPNFLDAFGLPFAILDSPSTYEEWALFGNVTVNLTDRFDISGGIRYSEIDQTNDQTISGILFEPFTGFFPASSNEEVITYLANARYKFTDHSTAYFRFATGYRPGGPNFVVLPTTPPSFEADTLNSYELGYRIESPDRAYSAEAAVFYIDWSDIQIFDLTNPLGGFANANGGAEIYGVELAATAKPIEGLSLGGSLAYQDASLNEDEPQLLATAGDSLPNVPEVSAAFNVDYEFPVERFSPTVGASVRYVSDRESTFSLSPQPFEMSAYAIVDLRAGITLGDIDAQFFVHNLGDERAQISAVGVSGNPAVTIAQPRTIGIRTSFNF